MGWVRDRFLAFNDGVGPKRFTIGAIFSAAVGVAAYIQAALPGSGISPGFPFSLIFGLLVLAGCIAWWLLDYAVKLRRQLKGAVDLEQALDLLSQYFDEGNNKIFNKRVASEADYGAWK